MNHIKNACIMLLRNDHTILWVKDIKHQLWMLPGGKLDRGESPWVGACREFFEETTNQLTQHESNFIYVDRKHRNDNITRIFIGYAKNQTDLLFNADNLPLNVTQETDAIKYFTFNDAIKYPLMSTNVTTVNCLKTAMLNNDSLNEYIHVQKRPIAKDYSNKFIKVYNTNEVKSASSATRNRNSHHKSHINHENDFMDAMTLAIEASSATHNRNSHHNSHHNSHRNSHHQSHHQSRDGQDENDFMDAMALAIEASSATHNRNSHHNSHYNLENGFNDADMALAIEASLRTKPTPIMPTRWERFISFFKSKTARKIHPVGGKRTRRKLSKRK